MKITKKIPRHRETRTRKKFAWIPYRYCDSTNYTVSYFWLETIVIHEKYQTISPHGPRGWYVEHVETLAEYKKGE